MHTEFQKRIDQLERDIVTQTDRLELFRKLAAEFEDIELPENLYIYAYRNWDKTVDLELSPADSDGDKDFQPLIHKLTQKYHLEFEKDRDYGQDSLIYKSWFEIVDEDSHTRFNLKIRGVVPGTCHVEEIEERLSDEEVEAARQEALKNVKTTRIVRKIVCKD